MEGCGEIVTMRGALPDHGVTKNDVQQIKLADLGMGCELANDSSKRRCVPCSAAGVLYIIYYILHIIYYILYIRCK